MTATDVTPDELPLPIRTYLTAHMAGEVDVAARSFAPTAVVVDDGRTYRGTDEVRAFLAKAGAEFSYTTELIGARRLDEARWVAVNRLEGDFPGGLVELDYRFTLTDDLITELTIGS